jgi:leucyl-tRNA synthetase
VISPDEVIEAFGADSLRLYLMFMGPFDYTMAWNQESLEGCYRFLKRVWNLFDQKGVDQTDEPSLQRKLNQTIKKISENTAEMKFNTAIAGLMELLNEASGRKPSKDFLRKFLLLLAPFAPHITEELWQKQGNSFSVHQQPWPRFDQNLIEEEILSIAVQVNGKLRGEIKVDQSISGQQDKVEELVKNEDKISRYLKDQLIKKVIFIPKKLINFVI